MVWFNTLHNTVVHFALVLQRTTDKAFGQCWTLNKNGSESYTSRSGPVNGLRIAVDVSASTETKALNYTMDTTQDSGVKVVIHNPGTHPFIESLGYNAKTGTTTFFALNSVETERLSLPWGNCTSSDGEDENPPSYFYEGNYTLQGCMDTCLQKKIIEECGCAHYG